MNKFNANKMIGVTKKQIRALLPNYFHSRIECGFHEPQMKIFREQCELSRQEKRKKYQSRIFEESIFFKILLYRYLTQEIPVHCVLYRTRKDTVVQKIGKPLKSLKIDK